ncbi:MAG: AAA family ATPase [Candidatus Competibacteraceae bacterium]
MILIDPNNAAARPDPPVHVQPKDLGRPQRRRPVEQVLAEILQTVFADRPGPLVIAIGGPGGMGKSTFADRLAQRLGAAAILRLDDYKTARAARRQAGLFGPHPAANTCSATATGAWNWKRYRRRCTNGSATCCMRRWRPSNSRG